MRSLISAVVLTVAMLAPAAAVAQRVDTPAEQDVPAVTLSVPPAVAAPAGLNEATGPSATAGSSTPSRYDAVGFVVEAPSATGITAFHRALPPGSFVEVTALDSGRTILVPVEGGAAVPERDIALSGAARSLLGVMPGAGVRIRAVQPMPGDIAALRNGEPATSRLDTPEAVLRALRRQLPAPAVTSRAPARPPVRKPRARKSAAGT